MGVFFLALGALILAAACSAQVQSESTGQLTQPLWRNRIHGQLLKDATALRTASAPAGAHLTYYGGRVVSNLQVVQVLYGTGNYLSQVNATSSPSMATFYQGVLNSPYVDWLTEYNTPTGTHQVIGRGSFAGQVTITPSAAHNGSTIDDTAIQSELAAQIQAGHLPAPTHDAAGNPNTYYAIFFPSGKAITQGGSSSCVAGGFCAYHGTIANVAGFGEVYYGVHPDMQAGSGCDTGCGAAATPFGNYTSVASHEMIETITDCEVGIATLLNTPPLAWYDDTNGEIGDICNQQQGTMVGSDGVTYVVQTEFSNTANNCIVSRPIGNDFSLSASPATLAVAPGNSGTSSIATVTTSGGAQTISLTATGLPAGVTASFSPSSVTSGASATLTLTASSTASAGNSTITITGTGSSATHTTTLSLTITTSSSGIVNGGFESGLTGWVSTGTVSVATAGCHGGTHCAQLGSTSPTNGDSTVSQTFAAPAGSTGISLWFKETCPDTLTFDWATVALNDATAGTTATLLSKTCTTNAWTNIIGTVIAGHTYTLTLTSHDDNFSSDPTFTLYDDVALIGTAPPVPDFALGAAPPSQTVTQGAGTSYTVTVTPSGGFTGAVTLSASGLPAGASATFSPDPTSTTSTMSLATAATTAAGTYPLTITGVSGSLTHAASVTLVVNPVDTTAPVATITSPANGSLARGTVTVAVNATDNVGVTRVDLLVDSAVSASLTAPPYSFMLNTSALAIGVHALQANAYDAAGNVGPTQVVSITVDNLPPPVAITSPASGATVTGTATVTASASDSTDGISAVDFLVDGVVRTTVTTSPYTWSWDTTTAASGPHTLSANAHDPAGNVGVSAGVPVTVSNTISIVQINCGGPAIAPFAADANFSGGSTINHANTIDLSGVVSPAPMAVYQTARTGNFTYTVAGFVAGSGHTVRLHFAETYFSAAGKRVFNVTINGAAVLANFDIFKTAGAKNKAIAEPFTANANASGAYAIGFASVVNNSLVSGIEIQ